MAQFGQKQFLDSNGLIVLVDKIKGLIGKKADTSELTKHTGNTTVHVTADERASWNKASSHAGATHAPVNAEPNQNAFSNVVVGSVTLTADSKTDSLNIAAGSNVQITPDAQTDKITISATDTKYTHPTSHPASMITQDASHRFVTDTEKSTWNSKAPSSHKHGDADITGISAGKIIGKINIDNLPAGALERCVVVASDTERFALTTATVQTGDTVKVTGTGKMYFVKNDAKLSTEEGYEIYTAGSATSVPWSGITGKPGTFPPSAHSHNDLYYTEGEVDSKLKAKAEASTVSAHTGDANIHVTLGEKNNWNAAKAHADKAHAPSNAQPNQNAFSNIVVGETTIAADSVTDSLTLVAGSNVQIVPDATTDKVTISATDTKYSHPGTHPATMITTDTTHRFVTDAEKATWDSKAPGTHSHTASQVTGLPTKLPNPQALKFTGAASATYDGSGAVTVNIPTSQSVANSLTVQLNGGTTEDTNKFTFNGGAAKSINITPGSIGAATSGHTHTPGAIGAAAASHTHTPGQVGLDNVNNTADSEKSVKYATSAGSASTATTASKLGSNSVGSATQPMFLNAGVPTACSYTLGKSVPSNAVFTDTNTWIAFKGATESAAGTAGYAPAPSAGAANRYLRSDGQWVVPPNSTYSLSSFGITATAAELNYCDGVTSNIQTQLNGKAPSSHSHNYAAATHTHSKSQITDFPSSLPANGGTATNSNNVLQTAVKSAEYTNWRTLVWGASSGTTEGFTPTTTTGQLFASDSITCQPSSGTIKAKVFKGSLSGNASSASSVPWSGVGGKPSSMPASDVHAWAKAANKPTYTKGEVGLGNVDNTADSQKSVKYATSAGSANSVAWGNVSGKPVIPTAVFSGEVLKIG